MVPNRRGLSNPLLSERHAWTLHEESAILDEMLVKYEVRTISHGRELPRGFSRRQRRRAPGMLFKVPRPNGEYGYSFRPDDPDPENPGLKYEQQCKVLGGPGNFLGIYQTSPGLLEDASVPLAFVEGVKKALALVSAARAVGIELVAVAILGVWNWLSDGAPIPDMLALPVEGRRCEIVFDSDMLRNPQVQEAARRLAEYLTGRDAEVWIAYLRDGADGSKTGADDFFAQGGTPKELKMLMRPYDPADFTIVRLNRSEELRASVRYLRRRWHEGDWMHFKGHAERGNWARGYTAYDTMEALITLSVRRGKLDERGVVVQVGLRKLAEMAAKTAPSVGNAVRHLEADGQLEILPPEGKGKPRRYRLLVPRAALYSMGGGCAEEGKSEESAPRCKGLRPPTAPRLRWSSPGRKVERLRGVVPGTSRVRETPRFSKGVTVRESLEEFPDRPYVKRLGPARGAVLDALEDAGREMTRQEIADALHRRARDLVRRKKPGSKGRDGVLVMLEDAGIIECEGDVVRLAADWIQKLDEERERKGEISQSEQQAEDHRKQGERYRDYLKSVKNKPSAAGLAAVKRSREKRAEHIAEHEEHQVKVRAADSEAKSFAKKFVHDRLRSLGRIRLGLLQEILRDEGGTVAYALPAAKSLGCTVERLPEFGNREFVFAPHEWGEKGAA